MNTNLISKFKEETQQDIIQTLKAYHRVNVTSYPSGKEEVSVGTLIKSHYSQEEMASTVEYINDTDLFTQEEIRENFFEVFGYYK